MWRYSIMIKIAKKLMDFGMGYEYEHNGSEGEKITSYELDVEINISQGKVFFTHEGETEEMEENERAISYVVMRIDELAIADTSSF